MPKPLLLPHQHGAWAFLALPVALAATQSEWTPVLLLLVPAWVVAYPLSWAVTEVLSARHPERYRRAAFVWAGVFAPLAVALVLARPWLWLPGLAYAVLFAVNVAFARAGSERSLVNDLVLVAECTAMVPIMVAVADGGGLWPPTDQALTTEVGILAAVCALALAGSTLHVKSLIRERRNPAYATASRLFALACVPVSIVLAALWGAGGWWLVVPFVFFAARPFVPGIRGWRPARVGLLELAGFTLVALTALLAG